jgi:hypothetical protein
MKDLTAELLPRSTYHHEAFLADAVLYLEFMIILLSRGSG